MIFLSLFKLKKKNCFIHVICNVVVDNQTKKTIEQSQVDFLIHIFQRRLQQHHTLALVRVPDIVQVINTYFKSHKSINESVIESNNLSNELPWHHL